MRGALRGYGLQYTPQAQNKPVLIRLPILVIVTLYSDCFSK